MLLLRHVFTLQLAVILFIHQCDGFMFNSWLRSTTEQNLSTPQYKYQNYPSTEAQIQNRYETNRDTSKAILNGVRPLVPQPTDKDVIAAYNNQRTGISAPPKYVKQPNGYNAVVVHSLPSFIPPSSAISYVAIPAQNYPYFYYKDDAKNEQQNNFISSFTTTLAPRKSVQVELNYKDDTVVEKVSENIVLQQKASTIDTASGSTELPQNKNSSSQESNQDGTPGSSNVIAASEANSLKSNLPNRPIKLVGPNPLYPYQRLVENFTFTPQLYYEPSANIQYAPYPFLKSPFIPPFGYRSVPRAVSERSEIPLPNHSVPVVSPIPVLTPVIPQSFDIKSENKPPISNGVFPICENCLLPPNYAAYPSGLKLLGAGESNQKPCSQDSSTPQVPSFKSNLAYIFLPSQAIKNQK